MTTTGLDGFLSGRWRHRVVATVLLRRPDGRVLLVRGADRIWKLPGGAVRPESSPRATAERALRRLGLDGGLGRLLVQDFATGTDGGSLSLVFDGGTWDTSGTVFTAPDGVEAAFSHPEAVSRLLEPADGERAAAALWALELGGTAELEDGRDATPRQRPGSTGPGRRLMPELPPVPGILRRD
ncbi:hypothetical protein NCCP1664_04440 [Zafaria cholistanensis]|uniref:Nudix hydrolase domain-containing protein n=1 Tax=Zafaria cholistanensis TaxID=1682741 RepID=A0A5A7NPL8_9MICC|nr:NUDIX domain-containing protein [Zafaria cholistanensis]GER21947.1 hypothetical protein NCCP1664_04440 [Zafaria cholistanensis]